MHMRAMLHTPTRFLFALILAAMLAGCAADSGESLPLEPYQDPGGRYVLSIPEGWQADLSDDARILTLTPPDFSDAPGSLRVHLFSAPTGTTDPAEHTQAASALFEPFLQTYLDDAFEVINEGETKVDKRPAVILDYARPEGDGYLSGRVVLAAMPGYALAFLGLAESSTWDAFLPTYREIYGSFVLISLAEGTPAP